MIKNNLFDKNATYVAKVEHEINTGQVDSKQMVLNYQIYKKGYKVLDQEGPINLEILRPVPTTDLELKKVGSDKRSYLEYHKGVVPHIEYGRAYTKKLK